MTQQLELQKMGLMPISANQISAINGGGNGMTHPMGTADSNPAEAGAYLVGFVVGLIKGFFN